MTEKEIKAITIYCVIHHVEMKSKRCSRGFGFYCPSCWGQTRHPSPKTKALMSLALTGRKNGPPSDETKSKMSRALTGRKKPVEVGLAISKAKKAQHRLGWKHSEETKAKMTGWKHSEETKAKLRGRKPSKPGTKFFEGPFGIRMRSSWEVLVAEILTKAGCWWKYEPVSIS